nr:TonB family protein [uncultured Carboxylicivirga sp.]
MCRILSLIVLFILLPLTLLSQKKETCYFKKKSKGCYFINQTGEKVLIGPFINSYGYKEDRGLIEKNLKFGYIDSLGQKIIDFSFTDAGLFVDGIAFAAVNNRYGFINSKGEFIIEPQYALANDFVDGIAMVKVPNKDTIEYGSAQYLTGLINSKGELLGGDYFTEMMISEDESYFKVLKNDSLFTLHKDGTKRFIRANEDELVELVDEMAEFAGGERELRRQIATGVNYPISAMENGVQGRCYVSFVVNKEGKIEDIKAALPAPPVLLKEAIRVVSNLPQWKPAKRYGRPIKISYTVPVNFVLQ